MSKNKDNTILTIRAKGIGFIILFCICSLFIVAALYLIVCFFIPSVTDVYHNYIYLIISVIALAIASLELVEIFRKGQVKFIENKFVCKGQNQRIFPAIEQDCKDFVSYKLTSKYTTQCLEFTFTDGKKVLFHTPQFGKKQVIQILNEIKKRGGFPEQEVKIEHYYI